MTDYTKLPNDQLNLEVATRKGWRIYKGTNAYIYIDPEGTEWNFPEYQRPAEDANAALELLEEMGDAFCSLTHANIKRYQFEFTEYMKAISGHLLFEDDIKRLSVIAWLVWDDERRAK